MDAVAAHEWIRRHVRPVAPIELVHERPWSTVLRIPLAGGYAWFKACSDLQAFEPWLTADLSSRWPALVAEVLAYDEDRGWLLLGDAGIRIGDLGNDPAFWLAVLPRYAEMQRGEAARTSTHLDHGVPDLRLATLPARYEDLLRCSPPIRAPDRSRLEAFYPTFEQLCRDIAGSGVSDSIQHDDLHMNNVLLLGGDLRVLDWGDSSISHPFVSLVATFRFLEERCGLAPSDPWFGRLRDAYLEPWGPGLTDLFSMAMRVGGFAHAIASLRQRTALSGTDAERLDRDLAVRLQRALAG